MSRIEQLIAELCPDGVEFKELSEVAVIGTGSSNGNEATVDGKYPLFVRSKIIKRIDAFEFDEEAIIIPGEGGIGEIFHYINGKYALHQRAYRIHVKVSEISTKFLCYYMMSNFKEFILQKAVNATVSSIRKPMIAKFPIPFPPLPIQQEIVRILDTFTDLDAELQAELEARKKQYEHYRNQLLNFEGKEVELKMLGEVSNYPNQRISVNGINEDNYVGVDNLLQNKQGKTTSNCVPKSGNLIAYKCNDILIGNIRPYLKKIWLATNNGGTNGDVVVIRINNDSNLLSKYLYYILSSDSFFDYNNQFAKGGKMPRGDKKQILKYKIPIPPLTEQERIVSILDKFEALVNDELPAEIAARRKQYEYYREKLLTFEPLIS